MQDALDRRLADSPTTDDPLDGPGTALLFATILNRGVPARFRLTDIEIEVRMGRHAGMPKREQLRMLYRAWRDLGVRLRRGWSFPKLRWGKQIARLVFEIANVAQSSEGNNFDFGEWLTARLLKEFGREAV